MRAQRLTRSLTNRTLGGVCGGLGYYVGVNPWWVRIGFMVVGIFTAGTGALLYLALWYLLPPQTLNDIPADPSAWEHPRIHPETVIVVGGAVILMGLIVLARNLGVLSGENGDAFLPVVVIVFGLVLVIKRLWRAA